MGKLEDHTCLITGAARGVGRGIALGLAEEGAAVVIADINGEGASTVADEIAAKGGRAVGVACDVSDFGVKTDQGRS